MQQRIKYQYRIHAVVTNIKSCSNLTPLPKASRDYFLNERYINLSIKPTWQCLIGKNASIVTAIQRNKTKHYYNCYVIIPSSKYCKLAAKACFVYLFSLCLGKRW